MTSPAKRDGSFPTDAERAQEVVGLLRRPAGERPRLILAFFEGPDGTAHFSGTASPQTREAVERADAALGRVLAAVDRLTAAEPSVRVTVLVTTDHGMRPVTHLINIERILAYHRIAGRVLATGTTAFVYLDRPEQVGQALERLSGYRQFTVFPPGRQPSWSHLGAGPRTGDLIVSAHPPYFIEDRASWPWALRWLARVGPRIARSGRYLRASHGYPPHTPGMHGILYATGAGIARHRRVGSIDAVDVHPTVVRLLEIAPGCPIDGRVVSELLEPPKRREAGRCQP